MIKHSQSVTEIMSGNVRTVSPGQSLLDARELMEHYGIRHVPVLTGTELVGILSRTDIMRASWGVTRQEERENRQMLEGISVAEAMSPQPLAVAPHTTIREAAEALAELDLSALPVLDNGELIGIITTTDLIRFLLEQY